MRLPFKCAVMYAGYLHLLPRTEGAELLQRTGSDYVIGRRQFALVTAQDFKRCSTLRLQTFALFFRVVRMNALWRRNKLRLSREKRL